MRKNLYLFLAILLVIWAIIAGFLFFEFLEPKENTASVADTVQPIQPEGKKYAQIMFLGDFMFDRGIRYYAEKNGGNNFIFEKISDELAKNDLNVVNLEGPITSNKSVSAGTAPEAKNNYFFTFDPAVAKTLFDKNIKMVDLGNNHILNFGSGGLNETKKYLDEAGVEYFGAPGGDKTIIKDIDGVKVAFISYNEFSGSKNEQKEVLDEITKLTLRQTQGGGPEADVVIVFCHWGSEYSKTPAVSDINLAHRFVDAGADLIIGSHPHVVQITELYKKKRIYYSLGNFIFDQYFDENVRNGLGVVVKINIENKELSFEEKHFYLDKNGQTLLR